MKGQIRQRPLACKMIRKSASDENHRSVSRFENKILWGGGQRPSPSQSEVANHPLWRRPCSQ